MYIKVVALTVIFSVVSVEAQLSDQAPQCFSDKEVAVEGEPRTDTFCKPEITHASKLSELRHCVCKQGYVRNAWGACISESECDYCMYRPKQDFSECHSVCHLTCGKWIPSSCPETCLSGCDCAPGFVRASGEVKECVPASECPPACPANATFQLCQTSCEPLCGKPPLQPDTCDLSCNEGECVCQRGYFKKYEYETHGDFLCVPSSECPEDI